MLQAVHMMKTKNTGFSPQRNIMMSWKLDLKYHLLWPKIESGQLPANCGFIKTKQCKTEVWVILGDRVCSQDCKLQEVKKLLASSASHLVHSMGAGFFRTSKATGVF